jgi:eukaryotic-like serine/threonine-protein kinase
MDGNGQKPDGGELPIAAGQIIGERYLVGEVLGGGGMGVVCAGTHVLLGTPVAIKLIHSELKDEPEAVQRFVNEARAAAALSGEHIARVFDVGLLPSGEPYLVMEQLEGIGLDQHLAQQGRLEPALAVELVRQACEGLAEAHAAALVHRDIKPANLFLTRRIDGQLSLKILDFGIAKRRVEGDRSRALTNPGKSLGSPWYMSPEQMLTPASVDERADVWSLGVLLFELLTGRVPFDGETVPQVCANVLRASPPPLHDYRDDVAPGLELVMLRCLEKEPEQRFRSMAELARALLPFAPSPRSYGSVPELTGERSALERPPLGTQRRSGARGKWLAFTLVFASFVGLAAFAQHRDSSLMPRVVAALGRAADARLRLPWDPRLSPDIQPPPARPSTEGPVMLQVFRGARAVTETEQRPPGAALAAAGQAPALVDGHDVLTPEQVRERVANYEEWLREQGLQRLDEADLR